MPEMSQSSMLDQLEVNPPSARRTDPKTSHDAAKKIKPKSRRATILRALLDAPRYGSTSNEIAIDLGVGRDVVSPHMKPLERLGFVVRKGVRKNPKTNNECEIWHLTSTGTTLANTAVPIKAMQIARKPDHICVCKYCGAQS